MMWGPSCRLWHVCVAYHALCSAAALGAPSPPQTETATTLCMQQMKFGWEDAAYGCQGLSQRSDGCGCCGASARVQGRAAASYRAQAAFYRALQMQAREEMAALYEGRPAALKWLATFDLQLPVEWVQHPPDRLDMCRSCATLIEKVGGY